MRDSHKKLVQAVVNRRIKSDEGLKGDLHVPLAMIELPPSVMGREVAQLVSEGDIASSVDGKSRSAFKVVDWEGERSLYIHCLRTAKEMCEYYESAMPKLKELLNIKPLSRRRNLIVLQLPESTDWSKVEIKMKEGLHDIDIHYGGRLMTTRSFGELGWGVGKEFRKSNAWLLLEVLSEVIALSAAADITEVKIRLARKMGENSITNAVVYKTKQHLSDDLCRLFNTTDSPFVKYAGRYQLKFRLRPEPSLRSTPLWEVPRRPRDQE